MNRVFYECGLANGLKVVAVCSNSIDDFDEDVLRVDFHASNYEELLDAGDIVYIHSHPDYHYDQVRTALLAGKHVMRESLIAKSPDQCRELFALADERNLVLMNSLRTAYLTACTRLLLQVKGGRIGDVVFVDVTCTNLKTNFGAFADSSPKWSSMTAWDPTVLLSIFQILGVDPTRMRMASKCLEGNKAFDDFSRISIEHCDDIASAKVGAAAKSGGDLVVSGTKGYVHVLASWWKTECFDIRYECPADNRRYCIQLEREGIRFERARLLRMIAAMADGLAGKKAVCLECRIGCKVSYSICDVDSDFENGKEVYYLRKSKQRGFVERG